MRIHVKVNKRVGVSFPVGAVLVAIFIIIALIASAGAHAAEVTSEQAGVCAVYLGAVKADTKLVDEVWRRAPDLSEARFAAKLWLIGATGSTGALNRSYALEGERACEGIIVWRKP